MANPRKVVPILLTFFHPAFVFAPSSHGLASDSLIYDATQPTPTSSNPIGASAGPRVVMMDQNYVEDALEVVGGPTVRVVISVDWEGLDLRKENLHVFQDFREAHPEVPLTHFLNAAYFTKSEVQGVREWSPSQVVRPIDEQGLHIQGLKSLVESSGVQYRSEPNTVHSPEKLQQSREEEQKLRELTEIDHMEWENPAERMIELQTYLNRDVGYETDIRAYSVGELQAIISTSKSILEEQGLKVGKSFRVGARLAGPNVLEAFQREGFRVNSSAVSLDVILEKLSPEAVAFWKDAPLSDMLRELWPGITKDSQPFLVESPVGWVLEMPDTGGPAEHKTVEDIVGHIDSAVQQLDSEDRFVHMSFDQETAATYAPRVIAAITEIKHKHGHRVVFETLEASAHRARSTQRVKELESQIKSHVTQNFGSFVLRAVNA